MLSFVKTLRLGLIVFILMLIIVSLAACGVATPTPAPTATSQYLDTPSLIRQALNRGEITEEERLLYLAYAVYEPESLPVQYQSKVGWFGDTYYEELHEVVNSPSKLCSMSPHVRSELLRLLMKTNIDTICK